MSVALLTTAAVVVAGYRRRTRAGRRWALKARRAARPARRRAWAPTTGVMLVLAAVLAVLFAAAFRAGGH